MILLEASGIKQSIKDHVLLDISRLTIHTGQRIGLVGPNGSGKTTLLHILAGKIVPDQGGVARTGRCELLPQLKESSAMKSGGEVTRDYIVRSLSKETGVLLADEPTTHLDQAHIKWLEKKISQWRGAFVVVSHDRSFLDGLCTTIWEINDGRVKEFKGNYSDYAREKDVEQKQKQAAYEQYETKKKQLRDAIRKKEMNAERAAKTPKKVSGSEARITGAKPYFAKKQKKLQKTAKALETRLESLEKAEKVKELAPVKMDLPQKETFKGRAIIRAEHLAGTVGGRQLWKAASFRILGGDKTAVIGPNGSGKTTLLKKILSGGEGAAVSPSVRFGYFSQNLNILDESKTVLENVASSSWQKGTIDRTVLARMHFYGEDVNKPVRVLSGGERVKVALAKLFVSNCNTLVLDEPTNFLDLPAMQALESLFREYEGTIMYVSHDRSFIGNTATKILSIEKGEWKLFDGTFSQYEQSLQQDPSARDGQRLLLETKITEVLSRLSIGPNAELEAEFQRLLQEKRRLEKG